MGVAWHPGTRSAPLDSVEAHERAEDDPQKTPGGLGDAEKETRALTFHDRVVIRSHRKMEVNNIRHLGHEKSSPPKSDSTRAKIPTTPARGHSCLIWNELICWNFFLHLNIELTFHISM